MHHVKRNVVASTLDNKFYDKKKKMNYVAKEKLVKAFTPSMYFKNVRCLLCNQLGHSINICPWKNEKIKGKLVWRPKVLNTCDTCACNVSNPKGSNLTWIPRNN